MSSNSKNFFTLELMNYVKQSTDMSLSSCSYNTQPVTSQHPSGHQKRAELTALECEWKNLENKPENCQLWSSLDIRIAALWIKSFKKSVYKVLKIRCWIEFEAWASARDVWFILFFSFCITKEKKIQQMGTCKEVCENCLVPLKRSMVDIKASIISMQCSH